MKILLQRVVRASVSVGGEETSCIGRGLLAFIGVEQGDDRAIAERLLQRLLGYRIFADAAGRMNLSVCETQGEILLVSQFTLAADTSRGRRPGFSSAMPPAQAESLYHECLTYLRSQHLASHVASGVFAADMQVSLVNDGPVTFLLSS